ncbi:MAG: hypothetical protein KJ787_15035 [Gammaproteobacteria bacterium]|nr:hypothetical protein [Gammaproteobacteria bacterium]MBU1647644.1 hypothetical protein [Gammaproteobacteria bacterium]MBU1971531.1 hypothetical protein [Gammaproteobacteria bacterium]
MSDKHCRTAWSSYWHWLPAFAAGVFILAYADFGPTDDHQILNSIFQGHSLYLIVFPELGRFCPLCFQELNLLPASTRSPFWFFLPQAISLLVFCYCFSRIIVELECRLWRPAVLLTLLLLSPGFVTIWLRIQLCERNFVVFLTIFLLFFVLVEKGRRSMLIPALAAGTVAMYFKEPGFIVIGVFAATHWLLQFRNGHRRWNWMDFLLLVSAGCYLPVYYIVAFSKRELTYGAHSGTAAEFLITLAKTAGNFALNDPFIFFIALPLAGWRAYRILRTHVIADPMFDAMLIAGATYALLFFPLNIFSVYYWTPAYVFSVPAVIHFYAKNKECARGYWRFSKKAVALLFAISVLPSGVHLISYYKYVPINFNATVDFIANDIQQKPHEDVPVIYIDSMTPDAASIYYDSLNIFLQVRGGLKAEQFVMRSAANPVTDRQLRTHGQELAIGDPLYAAYYSVIELPPTVAPSAGDYLIIVPQTTADIDQDYLMRLQQSCCDLVFSTASAFAVPNLSLKILLKLAAARIGLGESMGKNYFGPPDYFVFVRR